MSHDESIVASKRAAGQAAESRSCFCPSTARPRNNPLNDPSSARLPRSHRSDSRRLADRRPPAGVLALAEGDPPPVRSLEHSYSWPA